MRAIAAALLAIFALAAPAAPAMAAGVPAYRIPVCGTSWVPEDDGHGDYFNVYNSQAGSTCIGVSGWHDLAWSVTSTTDVAQQWQSPNISSGWEWGRYTCDDGLSASPASPGSQCMRYPVQARADGKPWTTVTYWRAPADGDVAWDIWFNKTDSHPDQDDGTEIMIRLADRNVSTAITRHVRISGREWGVENWTAERNGVTWNYVAYIAPENVGHASLWLNAFFADAERHGLLEPSWWLTSIDFLAEMNDGTGKGFTVSGYALTGVS